MCSLPLMWSCHVLLLSVGVLTWSGAAQNDQCMTSKRRESDSKALDPLVLLSLSRYCDGIHWSFCAAPLLVFHVVIGCLSHVPCFPLVGLCHVTLIVWNVSPSWCHCLLSSIICVTCCWCFCSCQVRSVSSQVCVKSLFVWILDITLLNRAALGFLQLAVLWTDCYINASLLNKSILQFL